jgi:diaminopropionate ammonia-lyase
VSDALAFHRALPGYEPTPVRELSDVALELGLGAVFVKDESARLGLPAFKILGASWAVERALREEPSTQTLVAASAGNHGRAVARVAAMRGLRCRIHLPKRALPVRRRAIEGEGAEVIVVDGTYEDAVAAAEAEAREPNVLLVADVGSSERASWVIDGYATLFAEAQAQAAFDVLLVPVGVGSLAAAAARYGAAADVEVVGVEPETAACLTASLAAGSPVTIDTPGTVMAGLDCAEVSVAAWPTLRAGIARTVVVTDDETRAAMAELEAQGLAIGESGAAPLAALRVLAADLSDASRVLLVATEGRTGEG